LRVGAIGLGKMGKLHFMNMLHMKGIKVVAVADKKKKNLRIAKKIGVPTFKDYRELLNFKNLDAVVISLPNFLKEESIIQAAE